MSTWARAALVRALKTTCQTAVALIGTGALGILDVDWIAIASAAALAGVVSILTSVAGIPEAGAIQVTDDERRLLLDERRLDERRLDGRDPATGAVPSDHTEP